LVRLSLIRNLKIRNLSFLPSVDLNLPQYLITNWGAANRQRQIGAITLKHFHRVVDLS